MERKTVTYEPDNSLKKGYASILSEILAELVENRWLTWQLFKRNFVAMYKQSFIGAFWVLIMPLMSVGTFIFMKNSGVFSAGNIQVPYPVYAMLGIAFWQLFSSGLMSCSNSMVNTASMIQKINFSKKSLVIAAAGQAVIAFIIQLILVFGVFGLCRFNPQATILLIPLLIIPILFLMLGIGFFLALLNGVSRDVGNILTVLITFIMFLTPILYARPVSGMIAVFTRVNPVFYLVSVPRDLILMGHTNEWTGFIVTCIFSFIVFLAAIVGFHLTETRVAERI